MGVQSVSPRRPHPAWKKLLFGLAPLMVLLVAGEWVARAKSGSLRPGENYRLLRLEQSRRGYPAQKDSRLGYVPRPHYESRDNFWGTLVTIDGDGFRSNGPAGSYQAGTIVAVGDSFTFGDQVDDDQSWPAHLERMLGRPVKNGGVFGYSFTQSILRAEEILERVSAEWLIVGFIGGDIGRSEFSKRYTSNPWFDIVDGELVLNNSPVVDEPATPAEERERRLKNVLGYSALLDALLADHLEGWWYMNEKAVRVHPPGKGVELALKLVERIADTCRGRGCQLLLVLQGSEADAGSTAVLEHARSRGVRVLDLIARFLEEERRDPTVRDRYFDGHMTAEGNRWVASHIARAIRDSIVVDGSAAGPR